MGRGDDVRVIIDEVITCGWKNDINSSPNNHLDLK